MYKVLYRKWRPKTFDEVVGQSHVTDILKNQVCNSRVPHALMFCGVRGTGKTSCAKIFAKAINCLNNKNGNPCLECEICKKIEESTLLDVSEIDAASNNGVENIRGIIEGTNLASSEAKYKVYIIDEFHMLSAGAFNAFLRTLEEPHENVVFILATTEYHKIPRTIISRCQRFDFYKVDLDFIKKRVKFVCESEKISIDDNAIEIISKNSEGSVRDALSILDQCSNFNGTIDKDVVYETLGLSDSVGIENIVENLFDHNLKEAISSFRSLDEKGRNIVYVCDMMMSFIHDLFCYKTTNTLFDSCNFDKEKIMKLSSEYSLDVLLRCFDILKDSNIKMQRVSNKKYELEEAIIKIFCALNVKKENKSASGIVSNSKKEGEKSNNETSSDDSELKCWGKIIEKISKISSSLSSMLRGSRAYVQKDNLMIDTNDLVFGMIKKSLDDISQIVHDETGKNYKICQFIEKGSGDVNKKSHDINSLIEKASSFGVQMTID